MSWRVPFVFPGGTVAVLGNGPSMNAADANRMNEYGVPTIAVNETYKLAPWAWMLYAADFRWWKQHMDTCRFPGLKASCAEFEYDLPPCVYHLKNTGIDGFDPDPGCVRTGNNGGYQSVHIAIHTGATRVLLLGFDMRGGRWWQEGSTGPARHDWINRFETLAKLMKGKVDIINCTPGSAMDCFPCVDLDDALEVAYGH